MNATNPHRSRPADRLRRLWTGNNRARLMLSLALAVMLPAAALIYTNFYHLKSIQRDQVLEASIHREFQQMLAISEKQLSHKAYQMAETLRERFPPLEAAKETWPQHLDALLAREPSVVHAFLFDEKAGMVFRTRPDRKHDPYVWKEHLRLEKMFDGWLTFEGRLMLEGLHKKTRPISWYPDQAKRAKGPLYSVTAFFPLPKAPKDRVAIGGVTFEPEYLQGKFFPQMLESLIAYKLGEDSPNRLTMVVFPVDSDGESGSMIPAGWYKYEPVAASDGWGDGPPEVTRNMDEPFRGLALGIKFQGTSIAALAQWWLRGSFIILGVLSLLMAGGLTWTYRNVSKEVELARLKSDFVSNVSHELRTPLSLIRLYAETLELGRVSAQEKVQEYYRIIRAESERLTALINNILDFSRIEAGRKEYEFRKTDLAELVCNTLDTYRDQIHEQGFTFVQSIDHDIPPVHVDREAIARSLVNLVNNALKYSAEEKYLGVKLYRTHGVLKLEVTDRGIGIARSEQAKIFEKFYRAGDPLVHNTKGSGLGLSLVRHIAHAHGGEVEVESTPGKGSTFTLTLPLEPGPSAQVQTSDAA